MLERILQLLHLGLQLDNFFGDGEGVRLKDQAKKERGGREAEDNVSA